MSRTLIVLFVFLFSFGQDINVYGGLGLGVHLNGAEGESSYLDLQDDLDQEPAITDFFDTGLTTFFGFNVGLFDSSNKDRRRGHVFIGMNYYNETLESLYPNEDAILLGNELTIKTFVPLIGYSFYRRGKYSKGSYYINAGPAFISYEGSHKVSGVSQTTTYTDHTGLYLGAGFITKFSDNLSMDIGASMVFRETRPLKIKYADDSPTYEFPKIKLLSDNTISIKIALILSYF